MFSAVRRRRGSSAAVGLYTYYKVLAEKPVYLALA
jgi:hypothetical protein